MFINLQEWIQGLGLSEEISLTIVYFVKAFTILLISVIADWVAKKILLSFIYKIIQKSKNDWDDLLIKRKVFDLVAHLAPAAVVYYGASIIFPNNAGAAIFLQKLVAAYVLILVFMTINALLNVVQDAYQRFDISRKKPIKVYIQVLKIVLYFLCGVFVLSNLIDKSPWGLISVFGGLTAVLILVFKDTILGFVASIQVIVNDMVSKGDWISMPEFGADGDVIDISVTTVKVQNWDKTISTIPTYALVSQPVKNWRGMSDSGGRRIKRPISIDMNSVKFCDEDMIAKFKKIHYLRDYIEGKLGELQTHNQSHKIDNSEIVNGRRMTNIGTFRAYVVEYLKGHPKIHNNMTFLVRHLPPTAQGLPIEIYVFSNDQAWANYEAIQADIFDHILAVIPEFGLQVFQNPSGSDLKNLTLLNKA